jgi:hypothetical protein
MTEAELKRELCREMLRFFRDTRRRREEREREDRVLIALERRGYVVRDRRRRR